MFDDLARSDEVIWRALVKKNQRLWRRLFAQTLAQAEVHAPDGTPYFVTIARNAPLKKGSGAGDLESAIQLAIDNVRLKGKTGWSIKVLTPPKGIRGSRELFRQQVDAQPIVVDIALVIVEAIRRGDRLWNEADEY